MRCKPTVPMLLLLATAAAHAGSLHVNDAWISEAPPGVAMLAGYLHIENAGDRPARVTAIRSERAEVMMHETKIVDGTATMRHVDAIEVPAHGAVTFAPGGLHLMIMGAPALKAGDRLPLEVVTADGESIAVDAEVRRATE